MLELSALLRCDDCVCASSHSSVCFCSRMLVWARFHAPFEKYRNSFRVRSFSFYDVWISLDVEFFSLNETQMEITNDLIESAHRMPECIRSVPYISLWFVGLCTVKRWGHMIKIWKIIFPLADWSYVICESIAMGCLWFTGGLLYRFENRQFIVSNDDGLTRPHGPFNHIRLFKLLNFINYEAFCAPSLASLRHPWSFGMFNLDANDPQK